MKITPLRITAFCALVLALCSISIGQATPSDSEIIAQEQKLLEMYRQKEKDIQEKIRLLEGKRRADPAGQNEAGVPEQNKDLPILVPEPVVPPAKTASKALTTDNRNASTGGANPSDPPASAPASANPQDANPCPLVSDAAQQRLCRIADTIVSKRPRRTAQYLVDIQQLLTYAILNEHAKASEEAALIGGSERKRTDKQVGAGSASSGTTSLVSKGGAPAIIGWAVENGAASSSVDGTTVTLKVNPYNMGRALLYRQTLPEISSFAGNRINSYFTGDPNANSSNVFDLRKLSLGFSFDISRGRETPEFIISKQQLSAWSVKYEFINHRNPLSPRWNSLRNAYFAKQAPVSDKIVDQTLELFDNPVFKKHLDEWLAKLDEALAVNDAACPPAMPEISAARTACIDKAAKILAIKMAEFPLKDALKNETVAKFIEGLKTSSASYVENRNGFLDEVNKGAIATLEYTNHREVNSPDWSNVRFVWEKGFFSGFDFTANAEMSFYHKTPVGTQRFKNFNFAFDVERKLNDLLPFGNSTFSGALRYTRQQSNVVLPNGVVADGTKGDILFGQLKLTIPVGDTGFKLPFSVTFGNRSEFIKEKFVRANFGFTLDLDQIFNPFRFLGKER